MKPFSVETIVGTMTVSRSEGELVFDVEGISDYLDIGHRLALPLYGFSYPDYYNRTDPHEEPRQSFWSFALWMACLAAACQFAKSGNDKETERQIRELAGMLRKRMARDEARMAELEGKWPELPSRSPERMVARGEFEYAAEESLVTVWEMRLSESLEAAADGKDPECRLPSFPSWPEMKIPLASGGIAWARPQFTGDLDVFIRREDEVRLDRKLVYGTAFYSREGGSLKREHVYARAYGKWPPEDWTRQAERLFDEAKDVFLTLFKETDAAVMQRCADVERILRENHADDLALFESPHDRGMATFIGGSRFSGRFRYAPIHEVWPGRYHLQNLPPFLHPKNARKPVTNLKAIVKRCGDGELALVGWSGDMGNGREVRPRHGTGRPDVALHVAREAISALDDHLGTGKKRKRT